MNPTLNDSFVELLDQLQALRSQLTSVTSQVRTLQKRSERELKNALQASKKPNTEINWRKRIKKETFKKVVRYAPEVGGVSPPDKRAVPAISRRLFKNCTVLDFDDRHGDNDLNYEEMQERKKLVYEENDRENKKYALHCYNEKRAATRRNKKKRAEKKKEIVVVGRGTAVRRVVMS